MFVLLKNRKVLASVIVVCLIGGVAGYYFHSTKMPVQPKTPAQFKGNSILEENSVSAPAQSCEIEYNRAPDYVGKKCRVKGRVDHVYVSKKGTVFLDFCFDYKTCPFTAVIFKDKASLFNPKKYEGKNVEISGLIKTYQGRPEIIIDDPSQIKIK